MDDNYFQDQQLYLSKLKTNTKSSLGIYVKSNKSLILYNLKPYFIMWNEIESCLDAIGVTKNMQRIPF